MKFDQYYDDDKAIGKLLNEFIISVKPNPSGRYSVKVKNGLGGIWITKPRLSKTTAHLRAKELRTKFKKWIRQWNGAERVFIYLKRYMQEVK